MKNFAMTGVAGFVAPRHLAAIRAVGGRLVAAADPHDSVGILDQFSYDVRFFPEIERFDRHLERLRRGNPAEKVDVVSVCSPNYLHDAHMRLALRVDADAICEKPLVINPWNLDPLEELEAETGRRVYPVLQLRLHDNLVALRRRLAGEAPKARHQVSLTYVTARGRWYDAAWKGNEERSGGLLANIGIHLFDLLVWFFGSPISAVVHVRESRCVAGFLEFRNADVTWFLSTRAEDLPAATGRGPRTGYRELLIDGEMVEFSDSFTALHTRVYEEVLAGRGFTIADARPAIELVHTLRTVRVADAGARHPLVRSGTTRNSPA